MSAHRRVDVAVIGGGIAGMSAAWELAAERSVAVFENEPQLGLHATGRSAAVISETSGTPEACALAAVSRPFLFEPPAGFSERSLLSPRGLLWVADESHTDELDVLAATARQVGSQANRFDYDEASTLLPVMRREWYAGGLYEPHADAIDISALLDGYTRGVRARGGTIALDSPVTGLQRHDDGWLVSTPNDTVRAGVIVNAAGAWVDKIGELAGLDPLGMQPLRRTAFTFPVDDTEHWPLVMDVASRFYFKPEAPGVLASPAEEELEAPGDARADELAMAMAVDALAEATTLQVRGVKNKWAGLRTFAPDRLPVIGFDPRVEGFFWLAGQGGAGIKTAPGSAALTTALIDGTEPDPRLAELKCDVAALSPGRLIG